MTGAMTGPMPRWPLLVALLLAAPGPARADEALARKLLTGSDERLYCFAEGERWSENAVRCLASQQHQRCLAAVATIEAGTVSIAPARWSDVRIGGAAPAICNEPAR